MLTEDMKLWHGLVIAVVSLILQACLFAAIGYLLSRHMAKESERLLKGARLQAPNPSPAHHQLLPAKEKTPSTSVSEPRYRHGLCISLPHLALRGWLCLSLFPSSFHCVHPLLTPPGSPWKNSFYFSLDDSDTSSGSSDSSDSSGSSPPACQAMKNMNYAQVVFSVTKELKNESSLDYENIKETTDYVNVNPKSHKPNFWTFAKPADSEPVEYTQVAL
ncbi:regulator of hemoglobinization and erythroid cell expansion protein isoform X1 [Lutra lutra]|uniref:regulator of hemoglobinization and erythroid cell expansion protein isoform X1 n=1 Tax=Lutra lutra TaxID=9657 RepID=UPI001FD2A6CE|nr:regulator of hemoglobinization and erythroid cell expansion protein isoform X1 [Lutra lutra]XP_047560922.1 regulator of hemoglobinization and erythroid cell expansion protein isoform X1 [Lutra lutra]XP_047560923.1 regulator of hemoglobinization and erythroid cell expansion protein isoform X1 [Lutra lutra]